MIVLFQWTFLFYSLITASYSFYLSHKKKDTMLNSSFARTIKSVKIFTYTRLSKKKKGREIGEQQDKKVTFVALPLFTITSNNGCRHPCSIYIQNNRLPSHPIKIFFFCIKNMQLNSIITRRWTPSYKNIPFPKPLRTSGHIQSYNYYIVRYSFLQA